MYRKKATKGVVASVVFTAMAMSPLFAPQALANVLPANSLSLSPSSSTTTQGTSEPISVTANVYQPSDTYQYLFNLYQNGTLINPIDNLYQVNNGSTVLAPNYSPTVPGIVYSFPSQGISSTTTSNFTLSPFINGDFNASVQLYDVTTNQTVGSAVYQSVYVTPPTTTNSSNLPITAYPTTATVGQPINISTSLNQTFLTQYPNIWFSIQVMQNGAIVPSSTASILNLQNSESSLAVGQIGYPSGISYAANNTFPVNAGIFQIALNQAGNYSIEVTTYDGGSNQILGSSTLNLSATTPNVSGTLESASGTPEINAYLYFQPSNTNANGYSAQTNSSGQYSLYLPDGAYTLYGVTLDNNNSYTWNPLYPIYNVNVTNGVVSGLPPVINLPEMGTLTATVTIDGSTTAANAELTIYPATATGSPDYSQSPEYVQADANGNISSPLPDGSYVITSIFMNGYDWPVNDPVTISANATVLQLQPSLLSLSSNSYMMIGNSYWSNVLIRPDLTFPDPVYIHATVTENGSPVTNGVTLQSIQNGIPTESKNLDSSGLVNFYQSHPITMSASSNLGLIDSFSQAGNYQLTYSIVDSVTGKTIATTSQAVDVNTPNVKGMVYAADGKTPLANAEVTLSGSSGYFMATTDGNGVFNAYLPSGTWSISSISCNNETENFYSGSNGTTGDLVTFTTTSGQTASPSLTATAFNEIGTVYTDAAKTTPLQNGWVEITTPTPSSTSTVTSSVYTSGSTIPSGGTISAITGNDSSSTTSTAGQNLMVMTNNSGQFALDLPSGDQFQVINAQGNDGNVTMATNTETVGSNGGTFTVSPPQPNIAINANTPSGVALANGYIELLDSTDFNNNNYANTVLLNVQNGVASGNLPAGNYVIFGMGTFGSENSNGTYYQLDDPVTISASSLVTVAVQPIAGQLIDANGHPIANASIELYPQGSSSQTLTLFTDQNGDFSDMGLDSQGNYTQILQPGQTYQITGVGTQNGWVSMGQTLQIPAAGSSSSTFFTVQIPAPLNGQVSVNGNEIQDGWVTFGPQSLLDTSGKEWQFAQIQNGSYSINLPNGTWVPYAVQDNAGNYYNEMGNASSENSITVTNNQPSSTTFNVNITNDFGGQLLNNGQPMANAWMEISPIANPQTQSDWSQVISLSTDKNGNFSTNLTPGSTWYLIGVANQQGQYTPVSQEFSLNATGDTTQNFNIAPNALGAISGLPSSIPTNAQAWLFIENPSTQQYFSSSLSYQSSGQWNYQFDLPSGTYNVLGVSWLTQASNGNLNNSWLDLSSLDKTIAVPDSNTQNFSFTSFGGTVSHWTSGTTGYVIFENSSSGTDKYASYSIDSNGQFSVPFDGSSGWMINGVESSTGYSTASGTYSNGTWAVTLG